MSGAQPLAQATRELLSALNRSAVMRTTETLNAVRSARIKAYDALTASSNVEKSLADALGQLLNALFELETARVAAGVCASLSLGPTTGEWPERVSVAISDLTQARLQALNALQKCGAPSPSPRDFRSVNLEEAIKELPKLYLSDQGNAVVRVCDLNTGRVIGTLVVDPKEVGA